MLISYKVLLNAQWKPINPANCSLLEFIARNNERCGCTIAAPNCNPQPLFQQTFILPFPHKRSAEAGNRFFNWPTLNVPWGGKNKLSFSCNATMTAVTAVCCSLSWKTRYVYTPVSKTRGSADVMKLGGWWCLEETF